MRRSNAFPDILIVMREITTPCEFPKAIFQQTPSVFIAYRDVWCALLICILTSLMTEQAACCADYVNLALNQPTWQSSTFDMYNSSLAVDGNVNPYLAFGSCMSTQGPDYPPWWAVDIGIATYVWGVNLTNSADYYSGKSSSFCVVCGS